MPFGLPVVPLVYSRNSSCSDVHRLGRTDRIGALHQLVVPVVATFDHGDVVAPTLDDDDVLDRRRVGHCVVGGGLQREHLAAPVAAVGGDQHGRLGVGDPVGERLRREAAEHDAVGGTDAGAGEHRDGHLGDHRHVDVDAVALGDTEALEHVGEPLHVVEELGVGDRPAVAGLTLPVEGDLVATAGLDVAIETVVRHVELATDEPLRVRQIPVEDGVPRLRPRDELRRPVGPEAFVVARGLVVEVRPGDQCVGLEPLGRREAPQLGGQVVDRVVLFLRHVVPFP